MINITLTNSQVQDILLQMQEKKTGKKTRRKPEYSPEFERFWKVYPPRWIKSSNSKVKVGKADAWVEWQKLDEDDKKQCWYAVKKLRCGEGIKDLHRWLHHRNFEDFEPPKDYRPAPQIAAMTKNLLKSVSEPKAKPVYEQVRRLKE